MWLGKFFVPSSQKETDKRTDAETTAEGTLSPAFSSAGEGGIGSGSTVSPFSAPSPQPETAAVPESALAAARRVTEQALNQAILVSALSILLCMTCLVGLTWAWFSVSVESGKNTLMGGSFDLEITVTYEKDGNTIALEKNTGGSYMLEQDDRSKETLYTVTLTRKGVGYVGFCSIGVMENVGSESTGSEWTSYSTTVMQQKTEGGAAAYTFTVNGFSQLKLTPIWGKPMENDKIINNGGTLSPVQSEPNSPETTTAESQP